MKKLSLFFGVLLFAVLPVTAFGPKASAQVALDLSFWDCLAPGQEFDSSIQGCDLSVNKEVSVNGGPFFAANTADQAVTAYVGDVVEYQITIDDVSNIESDYLINGAVRVYDELPTQVTYLSHTASTGTYDQTNGTWEFNLSSSTSYPLTLNIKGTANTTGQVQNFAYLAGNYCDGWCEYSDYNNENDGDSAWISINAAPVVLGETTTKPQVLAETTLADTGSGAGVSLVAGFLILLTGTVLLVERKRQAKH